MADDENEGKNRVAATDYKPDGDSAIERGYDKKFNNSGDLSSRETQAGTDADTGRVETQNDNPKSTTNAVRDKESDSKTWRYTGGGSSGKKKSRFSAKAFLRRKGPLGLIIGLFAGSGLGIVGGLLPGGALIHVKEVIVEKLDSMTPVAEERAMVTFARKVKATNATCKIKVRCRFKGISEAEMKRIRLQGADILDAKGKPIACVKGKCVGGKTIVMPNGDRVKASAYQRSVRSNVGLYRLTQNTFPRYSWWNSDRALKIRSKFKLVTDPKWGKSGDEKSTRQAIYRAASGQAESGNADVTDNNEYQKDKNGNQQLRDGSSSIDGLGPLADDVNTEGAKLGEAASAGERIDPLPSDVGGAAAMDEYKSPLTGKKVLRGALGFLNPLGFVVGMCTTYQITSAIVLIAQTIALANDMRYASQFVSTADKFKYGEGSTEEMEQAMTILQREDKNGFAFGDAAAYQYAVYGIIPAIGTAASAAGNAVIQVLKAALDWVNDHLGGKTTLHLVCGVITNTAVQVGLSLTTFIPGAGQGVKAITAIFKEGGKKAAEDIIKAQVKKIVEASAKKRSKAELRDAAWAASKGLFKLARGPLGMYLAGYLIARYGVPYVARQISNTMLTGDEDGVKAMDTTGNGFDATNAATSSESALKPLTKGEAVLYNQFEKDSKDRYVAFMRQESNPFDLSNPYSAGNSFATSLFSLTSKFNSFGDILSAPAAIFSSLNPSNLMSQNAMAAEEPHCTALRVFDDENVASTPFCNAKYGLLNLDVDPEAIIDYLHGNNQIDDNGDAVADSDYDKFAQKCITDSGGKRVTDIGEEDTRLAKECYIDKSPKVTITWEDETGKKQSRTLTKDNIYRLYNVDSVVSGDPITRSNDTTGFYQPSSVAANN